MSVLDAFRLDNQVAIITGAGAGIGRGIAEIFAAAGGSVVVSNLHGDNAEAVANAIREAGGQAISLACNVTEEADRAALVRAALDRFGKINLLVNNAGGGAILNISSMAAENKNMRMASYGSSKAAVSHLTRNIAFDLGPKGIRVNAIAPGAIRTAALSRVLTSEVEKTMLQHTPIGRLGEPSDIGYAALFLCSPASAWISGQVLTVSGGGVQELD
jgi:7-alpha-hydroxysteroid dehydrogenase